MHPIKVKSTYGSQVRVRPGRPIRIPILAKLEPVMQYIEDYIGIVTMEYADATQVKFERIHWRRMDYFEHDDYLHTTMHYYTEDGREIWVEHMRLKDWKST